MPIGTKNITTTESHRAVRYLDTAQEQTRLAGPMAGLFWKTALKSQAKSRAERYTPNHVLYEEVYKTSIFDR